MTVYPWESLVPLLNSSPPPTPPLLSPPLSAPPVPVVCAPTLDTQQEEDDDVFEPEGGTGTAPSDTSADAAGTKRRTQSLSALQSTKEPQSPLKVSCINLHLKTCSCTLLLFL